jgi:SAM-dependent methyltransferase
MEIDATAIRAQVRRRFAAVATDPASEQKFEIGRDSALKLGYDAALLDALPTAAVKAFAGVGHPLSLGSLAAGMTVLDIGCGAGLDVIIAAEQVGLRGKVVGIDMTDEMVATAHEACATRGLKNVEFMTGLAERLGLHDESVDVVISNGVINLCPDKGRVLGEVYRVLKAGGRLQAADMSLVEGVNPELLECVGEWSG